MIDERRGDERPWPPEVQALFARYKESIPNIEPGAAFMPGLWARIDVRRKATYSLRRLVAGFVTAAAALCLVMSAGLYIHPASPGAPTDTGSYVDVLAEDAAAADEFEIALVRSESL
jgi:hypothetical protein